jgi:predicted nucleic acid-binding protein
VATATRFLDTNVLLRLFTRDDERKAEAALALLLRIEGGEESVVVTPLVIFEVVFTLEKSYGVSRDRIREILLQLISIRGIELQGKGILSQAIDMYSSSSISFVDAYTASFMKSRGIHEIYGWDQDFDRLEGVVRLEPAV